MPHYISLYFKDLLAVDVGCGSGQSTQVLSPHFSRVVGLDVSEAQIKIAAKNNTRNEVEYR
jgi:2-polyprenyl-3-methyl-5-hydroxy-6-metoxy-1,4-benzoquinol methylase